MNRHRITWLAGILSVFAAWGCAQNPSAEVSASAERAARITKLQEEVRSLTAQKEQSRKDIKAALDAKDRLQEELDKLSKERDDLTKQLAARTTERDASLVQLDQIRKGIRALMEQSDAAATAIAQPAASTTLLKIPNGS